MEIKEICKRVIEISKEAKEDVSIFADGGWDNRNLKDRYFFVFKDGDGQDELFSIEYEDYLKLRELNLIGRNVYRGFKARSVFNFDLQEVNRYLESEKDECIDN